MSDLIQLSRRSLKVGWVRINLAELALLCAVLMLFLFYGFLSEGAYQDDSILHYLMARDA